ncbi:MAG: L-threonylcarbamoyladenylate synthase [Anaerolineae bacterium]|nr:L-threonylcarbamoyladenylate synthase [Anaerolineae bacterium]
MRTPCLPATEANIRHAAAVLRSGGLVAFPTETVYGLGANAFDAQAVARIYTAKQRALNDPLIVHIAAPEQIEHVADVSALTPTQHQRLDALVRAFWPGPLTVVVWRKAAVPANVSAGLDTVAVRCPAHPVAQALIRLAECPVAAPSANRFGHVSPTTAQHVLDDLDGRIDLVLDGGATPIGVESTVINLTTDPPQLLRPGSVTRKQITAVLGVPLATPELQGDDAALPSPGMLKRHYAPRARLILCKDEDELLEQHATLSAKGDWVGALLLPSHTRARATIHPHFVLGESWEEIAHNLYAGLRALDAEGVSTILAVGAEESELGEAIADRLKRAAAQG